MTRRGRRVVYGRSGGAYRSGTSRAMTAGHPATCDRCGAPIRPGDLIQYRDRAGARAITHALCDE